jgi:hypothetical protein
MKSLLRIFSLSVVLAILAVSSVFAQSAPPPPVVPIDGGASLLLAAAAAFGVKKLLDAKRKQ